MSYQRAPRKKRLVLTAYHYCGVNSGFKQILMFAIKGKEHPDPSKKLTWGIAEDGSNVPGDYNKFFTKHGKPIILTVDLTEAWTAMQEQELELKAIRDWLDTA